MRKPETLQSTIRNHLEEENEHTQRFLKPTEELRSQILEELKGRIKADDISVPDIDRDWAYYQKNSKVGQYPL